MMKDKDVTELPIKSLICHRADLFTKSKFSFSWNCTIFNKQERCQLSWMKGSVTKYPGKDVYPISLWSKWKKEHELWIRNRIMYTRHLQKTDINAATFSPSRNWSFYYVHRTESLNFPCISLKYRRTPEKFLRPKYNASFFFILFKVTMLWYGRILFLREGVIADWGQNYQ